MKGLLTLILVLFSFFAMTFVLIKLSGAITIEKVKYWLEMAKTVDVLFVGAIVFMLLVADLFIAVPTFTVIALSGFFLGAFYGWLFSLLGVLAAGSLGYLLSFLHGQQLAMKLLGSNETFASTKSLFCQHGGIMILLSRAMPILPEVTACLAGVCKMKPTRFFKYWLLGNLPYTAIVSYAGAQSSVKNPKPVLLTAIILTLLFSSAWYIFKRGVQRKRMFLE